MADAKGRSVTIGLLENGLDFIMSAVTHLEDDSSVNELKYAVLHLSSGIELVLKERLRREHWSLVFDDTDKADRISYEKGNFNSVTFSACITRLRGICGVNITPKQEKALKAIRDKRNRLEHFGIIDSVEALASTVAEALSFLVDFINTELEPHSGDEITADLIACIRPKLGKLVRFVEQRWNEIREQVKNHGGATTICPTCGQPSLVFDEGATCLFCGYNAPGEDAATEFVTEVMHESQYETVKDGGVWPIFECPECGSEALVDKGFSRADPGKERFVCFECGTAWHDDGLSFCDLCGSLYVTREDDMGICSDCFQYQVGDDD